MRCQARGLPQASLSDLPPDDPSDDLSGDLSGEISAGASLAGGPDITGVEVGMFRGLLITAAFPEV